MEEIKIINLYENLENELKINSVYINNKYSREFEDIKRMLDIHYKVYVIIFNNARFCGDEYFDMTFSIAFKNILSIYTCLKLDMIGLYGEANIIRKKYPVNTFYSWAFPRCLRRSAQCYKITLG